MPVIKNKKFHILGTGAMALKMWNCFVKFYFH